MAAAHQLLCCLLQGEQTACSCSQCCSPRPHTQCLASAGQSCDNAAREHSPKFNTHCIHTLLRAGWAWLGYWETWLVQWTHCTWLYTGPLHKTFYYIAVLPTRVQCKAVLIFSCVQEYFKYGGAKDWIVPKRHPGNLIFSTRPWWPLAIIAHHCHQYNQGLIHLSFAEKDQGCVSPVFPYKGRPNKECATSVLHQERASCTDNLYTQKLKTCDVEQTSCCCCAADGRLCGGMTSDNFAGD